LNTIEEIKKRLGVLDPLALEVEDESAKHAGHAGARSGGGHYRLTIVSDRFVGLGRLARHRLIYDAVGDLMRGAIHALPINALTSDEARNPPKQKEL
jgi:BolA protein